MRQVIFRYILRKIGYVYLTFSHVSGVKMPDSQIEVIRNPVQARSQMRVSQILEAARALIAHRGAAALKMNQIAETAGISMASIYQYFPNKRAIIAALAEQILQENARRNEDILTDKPRSLVQLASTVTELLDQYYRLQKQDPVVRDIWAGYHADKELRDIDDNDSVRNRDFIFEASRHLFRPEVHEQAKVALLILINFGGAAVTTAVSLEDDLGDFAMEEAKTMLYAAWEATILPLGRKR
ncbi:TetR/AcrR family transcriptional regulator [Yoonia sp. SS1-5]|uniref:TetR/AcrR family transcriptional regulator n=1 Tax=Yoonia rhodophyticola TaxID=3137370 RepID=A0AAN0MCS9_9RHOB